MTTQTTDTSAASEPWLQVLGSSHLSDWLGEQKLSLAFTTYQAGKLFLMGRRPDGGLSVFERNFDRCMGLFGDDQTLWLSCRYQLWRLDNVLAPGEFYNGGDRLYIPRVGYTTGDLDIHDVAVESDGRVVFVNTRFGCLATLCDRASFTPLWRPPFISKLAPEDRCHLNGLALDNGKARYATAVARCDVADGWRDRRRDGGIVVDVTTNQIVADGLSMPHSPRVYRGQLYVLNAGTGQFGWIDLSRGKFEPIAFCPGFLRGLSFHGDYAIVGISGPRNNQATFGGLALDEELSRRGATPRGGLMIIHLRTGDVAHWVRLEGIVSELYDVVTLPGVNRPLVVGFKTDEIQKILTIGTERAL